jgi:hypothetical protein
MPLERLHGKIGDDGIERVAAQMLFDILDIPQRHQRQTIIRADSSCSA